MIPVQDPAYRFRPHEGVLPDREAAYWRTMFARRFKVGMEIEVLHQPDVDRDALMSELERRLEPSKSNRRLGPLGVLSVSREIEGVEVKLVGRTPIFEHTVEQITSVFGHLRDVGCFPGGQCGMHHHYIANDLGHDLPPIILANIWNLTRWYAPALRFLTSGGHARGALTRRRLFCDHRLLLELDASERSMAEVKDAVDASRDPKAHYNFLNIEHVAFAATGRLRSMHLECRFPDADMSPLCAASKPFLFFALLLRATELSKYGVVTFSPDAVRERSRLMDRLSNDDGADAMSDTSSLTDEDIRDLQAQGREMIQALKPMFSYFAPVVSRVIELLTSTPVSLLRAAGSGWPEIDSVFASSTLGERFDPGVTRDLVTRIEMLTPRHCESEEHWTYLTAEALGVSRAYLRHLLQDLGYCRDAQWDPDLGTVLFRYR